MQNSEIGGLIRDGKRLPLAIEKYPSRGQTAIQELYQTARGKLFLKRVSERNHQECRIDISSGTLAEREFWAFALARAVGLFVPPMWLIDEATTVQVWLGHPDGRSFKKSTGRMDFDAKNVFECAAFDWVTGQVDRHDANYLYDYTRKVVIPVDSAHGFLKYEGALPDYLHLFEIGEPSARLTRKMKSEVKAKFDELSDEDLWRFVPIRGADERAAFLMRKRRLADARGIGDLIDLYRGKK